MFITTLITGFIVSSITVGFIMLIRKLFRQQLSAKWQYNLWFLLLIALSLPFIPSHFVNVTNFFIPFDNNQSMGMNSNVTTSEVTTEANTNWMQDFTVTVNQSSPEMLNIIIVGIWIAGMLFFTTLSLRAWFQLKNIKKSVYELENEEISMIFETCKRQLNISKNITLGVTSQVHSPLTFGLRKTYVVLPMKFEEWLSKDDIKHIFLHELNHYKYKDIQTNYFIMFYQIVYWFNPLVWIAFKEMRLDREIACDIAVLKTLDKHRHTKYGHTIIQFIDRSSKNSYNRLANQLNGSKKQIKRRIKEIASFKTESKLLKLKSIGIFMIVGLFVANQLPLVSVMANDNDRYYDFNQDKATFEDLNEYFGDYEGSFVLYNMQSDEYMIHDKDKSTLRISPDSTYKIYSALFGLEEEVITSEHNTMKWDGVPRAYTEWNRDQNLATALSNSVNWYFQKADRAMGLDTIQSYVNQINYGNQNVSGGIDQYWLESSLKISPIEQVQLLHSFYTNEFEFKERNIESIKDALKIEEIDGVTLYGKTGTGNVNEKDISGWFIGFIETETNTFFFATNIQDRDNATGSTAAKIALSILKDKNIYSGATVR